MKTNCFLRAGNPALNMKARPRRLKRFTNEEVDEAVVLSQIAAAFPHERPMRVLRTVVAWARYAELFKYRSARRVFYGHQQSAVKP
jgi:hypothetical protein